MIEVMTVKASCPICSGDTKGNDIHKYFCIGCFLLFDRNELATPDIR